MADFLGPEAYWWLGEREASAHNNPLPAMQLGAELQRSRIANALRTKELELDQQRSMLQTQEYFSKKEIQNKMMAGTADLAQSMAQFTDPTDPRIPETIYGVLAKSPMLAPIAEKFLDNHRQALQFQQKQDELKELRLTREQTAANALAFRVSKQESDVLATQKRIDIMQQRADTGAMDAQSRAEYRDFQREQSDLTHDEIGRRLAVMEQNTATRQQRLDAKINNLSPERRDLFKRDMDKLDIRAEAGDFAVKKPGGGFFSSKDKFGPKYFEERKKLEDSYGVTEQATPKLPLNTNLKNPITKDEYDKLPSGTEYIAPDGSTRVKK